MSNDAKRQTAPIAEWKTLPQSGESHMRSDQVQACPKNVSHCICPETSLVGEFCDTVPL